MAGRVCVLAPSHLSHHHAGSTWPGTLWDSHTLAATSHRSPRSMPTLSRFRVSFNIKPALNSFARSPARTVICVYRSHAHAAPTLERDTNRQIAPAAHLPHYLARIWRLTLHAVLAVRVDEIGMLARPPHPPPHCAPAHHYAMSRQHQSARTSKLAVSSSSSHAGGALTHGKKPPTRRCSAAPPPSAAQLLTLHMHATLEMVLRSSAACCLANALPLPTAASRTERRRALRRLVLSIAGQPPRSTRRDGSSRSPSRLLAACPHPSSG